MVASSSVIRGNCSYDQPVALAQWGLFAIGDAAGWTTNPYFEATYSILNDSRTIDGLSVIYGGFKLPGKGSDFIKLKGNQGWKDPESGLFYKKDKLHKDHWIFQTQMGTRS